MPAAINMSRGTGVLKMQRVKAVHIRRGKESDIPAIARILVDTWRSTFSGLLYAAFLDSLDYRQQEERHRRMMKNQKCIYQVAVDEHGQLVAFANVGPDRTEIDPLHAELYAIYVRGSHQGNGVGRKLVAAVASHLALHGHSSLRVWVLAVNPFIPFYERMGGRKERVDTIEFAGQSLEQVSFVWSDVSSLSTIRTCVYQ